MALTTSKLTMIEDLVDVLRGRLADATICPNPGDEVALLLARGGRHQLPLSLASRLRSDQLTPIPASISFFSLSLLHARHPA